MDLPYADGCSGFMSYFWRECLGHPPPWEPACNSHDKKYEQGGSLWQKLVADCVVAVDVFTTLRAKRRLDFWLWPVVMFLAVRIGGVWFIPFPTLIPQSDGTWKWSWNSVRWGYSHKFPFYVPGQTWGDLIYPRILAYGSLLLMLLCVLRMR